MKLSIIICTKDRPKDIGTVLGSLSRQSCQAHEIIIVDGSDHPVEDVVRPFQGVLPIVYKTLRPPGLTKQRNFGISQIDPTTDWVAFLDDDLVLDQDCLESFCKFASTEAQNAGIGLRIYEQKPQSRNLLRELMLLDKYPGGKLTLAGCPATIRSFDQHTSVEWIYGGATFWKRNILEEYKYDEWFSGIGYFEDVDFSYRVSRKNKLAICATAKCHHYHHQVPDEKMVRLGEWLIVAWWYFSRVKNKFNPIAVLWGMLWMSANNLIVGVVKKNPGRQKAFQGNLKGLTKILTNSFDTNSSFQK